MAAVANPLADKFGTFAVGDSMVPTHKEILEPMLREILNRGGMARPKDLYEPLANYFNLTENQRRERLDSDNDNKFENRVRFARFQAVKLGLIEKTGDRIWHLTTAGIARARSGRDGSVCQVPEAHLGSPDGYCIQHGQPVR